MLYAVPSNETYLLILQRLQFYLLNLLGFILNRVIEYSSYCCVACAALYTNNANSPRFAVFICSKSCSSFT